MSDSNEPGTSTEGTQAVEDTATSTGTAAAGTPSTEATDTGTATAAGDSQSATPTTTDPATTAPAGTQDPNQAKPGENAANQWDSDANPYRKRFNDTLSHAQQLYQEKQQRDRQLTEYQQKIAAFEQERAKDAERQQLKRWNSGHPEHAKFRSLSERASNFNRLLAKAETPEQKQMLRQMMAGEFAPDELQELEQAEQDRRAVIQDFTADPRGFIAKNVEDAVRQHIQQYDTYQASRSQVQQIIGDPNNAKLIESYAPDMQRIMDPSVPARDKAFEFARVKAENDALKAQLGMKAEQVATAEARQAALGGKPADNGSQRNQRGPVNSASVMERLAKRGIKPGDSRFQGAMTDELLKAQRT